MKRGTKKIPLIHEKAGKKKCKHEKKDGKLKTQNKAAGIGLSVSNVTVNMNCICLFHKR